MRWNSCLHPRVLVAVFQVPCYWIHASICIALTLEFIFRLRLIRPKAPFFPLRLLKCCQKNCCHYVFVVILWIDVYKRGLVYFLMALPCFLQVIEFLLCLFLDAVSLSFMVIVCFSARQSLLICNRISVFRVSNCHWGFFVVFSYALPRFFTSLKRINVLVRSMH